jgi:general secretion pathway protein I
MNVPRSTSRGFTLVEILIALAVLAIALAAVMRNISQSIDTTAALRDRAVALWIAENRLATHELKHDWPATDTTDGDTTMGGRQWRWREQVIATPDADMKRIEIEIRGADGKDPALARLVGFLRKPAS